MGKFPQEAPQEHKHKQHQRQRGLLRKKQTTKTTAPAQGAGSICLWVETPTEA